MDTRELLVIVKNAVENNVDFYTLATEIATLQKEEDARVAEALNQPEIAAAIRA